MTRIVPPPLVIAVQSQVAFGHVGNSAAVFPMQANGCRVVAVPTTLLSNHPHYPTMRGRILDAGLVQDLLLGVEERGLIEQAAVLLTGYLGSAEIAGVVADFVARARRCNPALTYVCDPVIGDVDVGVYVAGGIREAFVERLVPAADVITPNQFELGLVAGRAMDSIDAIKAYRDEVGRIGPARIIATGCQFAGMPESELETVVANENAILRIVSAKLPTRPSGTGDLFTAHLASHLAYGIPLGIAAERAVQAVTEVLHQTIAEGSQEMAIVKGRP